MGKGERLTGGKINVKRRERRRSFIYKEVIGWTYGLAKTSVIV